MSNGKPNGNGGNGFDLKQVEKVVKLVEESNISGLTVEMENFKLDVRKEVTVQAQHAVIAAHTPVAHHAPTAPAAVPVASTDNLVAIKSPMVGTFYAAASPESPAFVKVGDTIQKGDAVCVIEAMKLFNELEAEVAGTVEKILVQNAQSVEYGQELILVRPLA